MNYYEHHLGDYAKGAGHLSMIEDGAYRRLLDAYYVREGPLPGDVRACCKLARATTKAERDAVARVLDEFFDLHEDGHHQGRCDAEITRYEDKQGNREEQRKNETERQRRHRARRRDLFNELRAYGEVPAFDTSTAQLEALLSRVTARDMSRPVTRDATATHTPVTSHQPQASSSNQRASGEIPKPPTSNNAARAGVSETAERTAAALQAAGCEDVHALDPRLHQAIEQGLGAELIALASTKKGQGKGLAYLITTVKGQRSDADAAADVSPSHRPSPASAEAAKHAQQVRDLEAEIIDARHCGTITKIITPQEMEERIAHADGQLLNLRRTHLSSRAPPDSQHGMGAAASPRDAAPAAADRPRH